jgi:GR25 family glycosyltransferase involved in LPS biosynthesis
MDNPFNFFDKIFCINLQKRVDRWQESEKVFLELAINDIVTRYNAIDYSDEESISPRDRGRCGCAQSFLNVVKTAKEQNCNNVLIFEDDIKLHKTKDFIFKVMQDCIKELPYDWEFFYLSANPLNHVSNCVLPFSENLRIVTSAFCCHAVAINANAYDMLLHTFETQYQNDIKQLVNRAINFDGLCMSVIQPRQKTYMPKQLLFTQRYNYSNIDYDNRDINNIIIQTYQQNQLLEV